MDGLSGRKAVASATVYEAKPGSETAFDLD
jgi:hypothetical protein